MALPPYLFSLGLPLLAGIIGIGFLLWNQGRPQAHKTYENDSHTEFGYDRPYFQESCSDYPRCSICLEDIRPEAAYVLSCAHTLHNRCVLELLKRGIQSCPECRTQI